MSLSSRKTTYKNNFLRNYTIVFLVLSIFSVFFGYSFDESVFSGYAANFYYYGANPFYYWGMGLYYLGIDIAGYFFSILINIVGVHNVLIEEFGVKLPIDISAFLGGLVLYRLLRQLKLDSNVAETFAFVYLLGPMIFFYSFFQGNPLDFTLLLLLLFLYSLVNGKYKSASFFLAVASASYLYPLFLFPVFVYFVLRKTSKENFYLTLLIYLTFTIIGIGAEYIAYYIQGIPTNAGTAISSVGGVASLSSSMFTPPLWNIYYFLNLMQVHFYYYVFQIFFIFAMLGPAIYLIWIRRQSELSLQDLVAVMAYQGIGFAMFSPISDPQYLLAAFPFILVLSAYRKEFSLLYVISAAAFIGFLMVAFVVPYNFNQYFVDVNPSAGSIQLFISQSLLSLFSVLYSVFCIIALIIIFKIPNFLRNVPNPKNFLRRSRIILGGFLTFAVTFAIFSFIIISPGISHLPSQFAYQTNDSHMPIELHQVGMANISGIYHQEYSFTTPEEWNLIPNSVKENSDLGIYLNLQELPVQYGTIAGNDIIPINSTHFIGETFYLEKSSRIILRLEFVNKSYEDANIYIVKGTSPRNNNIVYNATALYGSISFNTIFSVDKFSYTDVFNPKYIFPAGNYSVIVSGTTNESYYLKGWNGAPSGFNVSSPYIIGSGSTIAVGKRISHLRLSMAISAYYVKQSLFLINGNMLTVNESGYGGVTVKIPAGFLRENNTLVLLGNGTASCLSPTIFYYQPFPDSLNLLAVDLWNVIIGAALFGISSVLLIVFMRRIILWTEI